MYEPRFENLLDILFEVKFSVLFCFSSNLRKNEQKQRNGLLPSPAQRAAGGIILFFYISLPIYLMISEVVFFTTFFSGWSDFQPRKITIFSVRKRTLVKL